MKTRHSKGMLDSSEATPRSPPGHNLEMDLDTDMASGTEEQAASTVNQLDIATTQPKNAKKVKKRTAKDSSTKRTRKTPFDRIQLSYAASLPPIVWVFDTQYQWWPGKIHKYPPQGNSVKVTRFGNVKPKSLQVDVCTERNILPFLHQSKTSHQKRGKAQHAGLFEHAYKEATEAQMMDDDGLPDDIISLMQSSIPKPTQTLVPTISSEEAQAPGAQIVPTRKKDASTPSGKTTPSSSGYFPDKSLSIPGELVLARAQTEKVYYPGKVMFFNDKTNKYKVYFATGNELSLERTRFFTRYEEGFLTCQLGALEQPKLDPNYENDELKFLLSTIYPRLYETVAGAQDEGGRLTEFLKGGKARRNLSARVSPGRFNRQEQSYISHMLQAEFLPDLVTTKRLGPKTTRISAPGEHDTPMKKEGDVTEHFDDQMRLHFVTEVLLPETITRLTMDMNKCTYKEADEQVERMESNSQFWVDEILAARESFLEGRASAS
ncbi:hypothetical protein CPB97_005607 [Podila verticillata]|nr:hypothetical protein CPB97_005607 [Podila verticillata]